VGSPARLPARGRFDPAQKSAAAPPDIAPGRMDSGPGPSGSAGEHQEETDIMRMRVGALLAAVTGLVAQAQLATAGHGGAANYSSCPQPVASAHVSFPACQQQLQPGYRLVYDNVMETRWHTTYQTVQETVMKQVCKTCYREEPRTTYKTCYETCYKDVTCPVTRQVPVTCYKDVCYTVCRPAQVQQVKKVKAQVAKQICEQKVKCVEDPVCRTVQETCYKDVCCTTYKDVVETQYKCEKRKVCKPVTYMKTVTHKCNEWVEEQYCVPGKKIRCKEECRDVTYDPCGCGEPKCGHWKTCRRWTCEQPCEIKCRKV
jgi:hypothetical protein